MIEQDKMYEAVLKSYARFTKKIMVWFFHLLSPVDNNRRGVSIKCLLSGSAVKIS